jgi:uncharacterized protein
MEDPKPFDEDFLEFNGFVDLDGENREVHMLICAMHDEARLHMSRPEFDASHDFNHIKRVVRLAAKLAKAYEQGGAKPKLRMELVILAALSHDMGDHKYVDGETAEPNPVEAFIKRFKSPRISDELAEDVQAIVSNVSYSHEILNPEKVRKLCEQYPELAVVQDADRLDAIGAVGIARCFTYGGAKGGKGATGRTLGDSVQHFQDKLLKVESMMKTEEGKRLAKARTDRIRLFMDWWDDETAVEKVESNESERPRTMSQGR